jgi:hypothetical protein
MMKFAAYLGVALALSFTAAATGSVEALGVALAIMPIAGAYASYKLWRWHQFYGTRFLWGLFIASIAAFFASLPTAFISIRRVLLGEDAPPFPFAVFFLGASLLVLEGTFVYLVSRWHDLDLDMKRKREGVDDSTDSTNRPPGDTFHSQEGSE